jgi:[glutamine synthetase] adenylyltransferase / [glutamine synthetase]-adenylyl-L-tyrosine phosphorylase
LVSSVAAFKDYQQNKAWVWEHQAITRARFIAGDKRIEKAFEQIRSDVLCQARDVQKLKLEVIEMREKMRLAQHLTKNSFDIKHSLGGIIDVEFITQYLVLAYSSQYPQLSANIGNIGLLKLFSSLNLIDHELAEKVTLAYREYRKLQHEFKLQDTSQLKVEAESVALHSQAVLTLWESILAI